MRRGFTLIELIVVILIIGIIASFAVPSYLKTVEVGKADDAVASMSAVAHANRMFALDHAPSYVTGKFPLGGSCLAAGVTDCPAGAPYDKACYLVSCKYLADEDWGAKPYQIAAAASADASGSCIIAGTGGANVVACAKRKTGLPPGTDSSPYNSWWYATGKDGAVTQEASAPQAN